MINSVLTPVQLEEMFLCRPIFPKREVHLLVGETGTGKTSLLVQWMTTMHTGGSLLGHPIAPQREVYVSNERSKDSLLIDQSTRWKLHGDIPFTCFPDEMAGPEIGLKEAAPSLENLQRLLKLESKRGYKVVIIDPIIVFCPKPNDQNAVHKFLVSLAQFLKTVDITLFATGHPPKGAKELRSTNVRTQSAGSQAWGAYSGTVMNLEFTTQDPLVQEVRLDVAPRHAPPEAWFLRRNAEGMMEEYTPEDSKAAGAEFILNILMDRETLTRKEVMAFANEHGISIPTADRWIKKQKDSGFLVVTETYGTFRPIKEVKEVIQ